MTDIAYDGGPFDAEVWGSSIVYHMGTPSRLSVAHANEQSDGVHGGMPLSIRASVACERHVGGRVVLMPLSLSTWRGALAFVRYVDQFSAHRDNRIAALTDSPKWSMQLLHDGSLFVSSKFAQLAPVNGIAFWAGKPVCIVTEFVRGGKEHRELYGYGVLSLRPAAVEEYVDRWSNPQRMMEAELTEVQLCMSRHAGDAEVELALALLRQAAESHGARVVACSGFRMPVQSETLIVLDVRARR
ncbi:MAG: hypothetical protein A2848_02550 [Candidatus Magasanikbacteria bacterium RIFCSPHIGHO2_01_FULL_50_8]|nr:MAG: hypothetical protein A2848_02550 [Candidatus Magasanikbacteria bacterium RIFCSPHIGHO2_01_FULL_50_8]